MTIYDIISFILCGAIIAFTLLGVVISILVPSLDKWNKNYFISLFSLLFVCVVICFLDFIFWNEPSQAKIEKVIYFIQSILVLVPIFMPTLFLLHSSHEKAKQNLLFLTVIALLGIYFIMLIVAQFTDIFYCVTPENVYLRGPFYMLSLVPIVLVLLLNIFGTIKYRKSLSKKYFIGFLIYLIPMCATVITHMFIETYMPIILGMTFFALIMHILILYDNAKEYVYKQREIANQKANIMALQMRPHFIYNSLMGIYYLCDKDANKAKQVTLDFTTYLRKNFSAMVTKDTIPFTEELEHTRAYLAIEQSQFEDSLFVNFDTPNTSFRLPPLTLQPIVENAVVHGMRNSNSPIHIYISTRKTDKANEIIVEDDGPGFSTTDNNEPHIALNNIRERLDMMCSGTICISSREGGGTSVTITIPFKKLDS